MSAQNQIVLPKRVIDEYQIKPRDVVGILCRRAGKVGLISFEAAVHRHNNTIVVPRQVVDFCGFHPRTDIRVKLIRVRHK